VCPLSIHTLQKNIIGNSEIIFYSIKESLLQVKVPKKYAVILKNNLKRTLKSSLSTTITHVILKVSRYVNASKLYAYVKKMSPQMYLSNMHF